MVGKWVIKPGPEDPLRFFVGAINGCLIGAVLWIIVVGVLMWLLP